MSDKNREISYMEAVFQSIENLNIWEEGKINRVEDGILFQMSGICGREDFGAIGNVTFEPLAKERRVAFMNLYLVIAKEIEEEIHTQLFPKLYELNVNHRNGVFFVDQAGNLCYEAKFPVVWGNVESAALGFAAEYMEISEFLDGMYPYILRCVTNPKECELAEYVWMMTRDTEA